MQKMKDFYVNPNICDDELKNWAIDKFNLSKYNEIKKWIKT